MSTIQVRECHAYVIRHQNRPVPVMVTGNRINTPFFDGHSLVDQTAIVFAADQVTAVLPNGKPNVELEGITHRVHLVNRAAKALRESGFNEAPLRQRWAADKERTMGETVEMIREWVNVVEAKDVDAPNAETRSMLAEGEGEMMDAADAALDPEHGASTGL